MGDAEHPMEHVVVDVPEHPAGEAPASGSSRRAVVAGGVLAALAVAAVVLALTRSRDGASDVADRLAGRTWVQTARFDRVPSVRTPVLVVSGATGERLDVSGHDGCTPIDQTVTLGPGPAGRAPSGTIAAVTAVDGDGGGCDDPDATPIRWEPGDLLVLADDRITIERGGDALAELTALDILPAGTADDLTGTWLLDRARAVRFEEGALAPPFQCRTTRDVDWRVEDGTLTVDDVPDDILSCVDDVDAEWQLDLVPLADRVLRDLIARPVDVRVVGGSPLLIGATGALRLVEVPDVPTDPDGLTVATGAAFGVRPGVGVGADDVLDAVVPVLGRPTYDSGWVDVPPGTQTLCPETADQYRELWWGLLRFDLWQRGARTSLQRWRYAGDDDRDVVVPPLPLDRPDATELPNDPVIRTEAGLTLGDSADGLVGPDVIRFDDVVVVVSRAGSGTYELDEEGDVVVISDSGLGEC